jgi:hypothetical protein
MSGSGKVEGGGLLLRIAAGLALFAVGAALALALLPEWTAVDLRSERYSVARYRQVATRAGFQVASGEPRVSLTASGTPVADPGSGKRSSLRIEVHHRVGHPGEAEDQTLTITFSPAGKPLEVAWQNFSASFFGAMEPGRYDRLSEEILSMLLAPGEAVGAARQERGLEYAPIRTLEIVGASPPEHLQSRWMPITTAFFRKTGCA